MSSSVPSRAATAEAFAVDDAGVAECPARSPIGIVAGAELETTSERFSINARRIRDADELLARERDARRKLEAEKIVRERLLALMTCELVTQSNVASGWLSFMRREHLDARAREMAFAKVDAALNAQLSLLDELVGMTPAAVGHVNLDCRRVDVAAIARAVAADVGDDRAHVVATEAAVVVADVEHVIRALRALITAATRGVQFVRLHVAVDGDYVSVRLSNAIRSDADGLSVARRVATLYGGEIAIEQNETVFLLPSAAAA